MTKHDTVAVPLVTSLMASLGYSEHVLGAESDTAEFRASLFGLRDRTSLMLRFRPDRVYTHRRSAIGEIKSQDGQRPNFAVEVDSLRAALEWNANNDHVIYFFVDLATQDVMCCWAREIPRPEVIFVPTRWDYAEALARLDFEWPGVRVRTIDYCGGSGTPFFLVPKTAPFLAPFAEFAARWLI